MWQRGAWRINDQRWKVYQGQLRKGLGRVIEIQLKENGSAVIPWIGFDDCSISATERLAIARRIVRLHNEDLNRQANTAH